MKHLRIAIGAFSNAWILASAASAQTAFGPAWTAESDQRAAFFGTTVSSAGDINGDGYDDVLVSAPSFDNGQTDEGRLYVFHGSSTGLAKLPASTLEFDLPHTPIQQAAAAGDVNGDGYGDVIVSIPSFTDEEYLEGMTFLYLGSAAGLATIAAWSAEGDEQAAYFGSSAAAAGDVNGDGYDDVIVGAMFGDLQHTPQSEGAAFVYLGSAAGLFASPVWSAAGNQEDSGFGWFGTARCAGDVNGDGYGDVIVGASYMGRAFVYLGSAAGPSMDPSWTADGGLENAGFGSSVDSAGDVNGDGYDDVIVGAPGYRSSQFFQAEGLVNLYLGSAAGLSTSPAWTLTGDQGGATFGLVAGAGDLNADGFGDVVIGAPSYDHATRDDGRVVAFFGSALGLRTRTAWIVTSGQRHSGFGSALAGAGDVNADRYDDVIVGAPQFDAPQLNEGRAHVYLGSATRRLR